MRDIRVGIGYDVHRFCHYRPLIVGGLQIPHPFGLVGHSDADVLIHAICDALLGAAGLGDIGRHFSDKDPQWQGQDSRHFLRAVMAMLSQQKWRISNLDATLIAEQPKFVPYFSEMQANLASDLGIGTDRINLKATTEEHMGFTGAYEGMAAHAVALIYQAKEDV